LSQGVDGTSSFVEPIRFLVDSARLLSQIEAIRRSFGHRVVHVHLTAPESELRRRYLSRRTAMRELPSYAALRRDPTEAVIDRLQASADIVIDTHRNTRDDVVVRVASQLGFYGRGCERLVDVLVGGEYGSEGKGQISAYLAPEYDLLIRVGGPNAGHQVFEEPVPRTWHHLPSGTARNPRARIVLGPGAVLRVPSLLSEIAGAEISYRRLAIDPKAMIISDEDVHAETSLKASIGSTGQGVGYATARKVLRGGVSGSVILAKDIPALRRYIRDTLDILDDAYAKGQRVFLEGTQGTGLSLHHGDYPHVTSRDTTVGGCLGEAGISPARVRRIVMVCRTYPIRVQSPPGKTSGKMSRELTWVEIARRSRIPFKMLRKAERTSTTKRKRRVGEFDWTLIRRAASLNGPTDIALTFVDYIDVRNRKARRFDQLTPETLQFIAELERVTSAPVSLVATRFAFRSIIDRRMW
jgi:adenylosuccinate synthase